MKWEVPEKKGRGEQLAELAAVQHVTLSELLQTEVGGVRGGRVKSGDVSGGGGGGGTATQDGTDGLLS